MAALPPCAPLHPPIGQKVGEAKSTYFLGLFIKHTTRVYGE